MLILKCYTQPVTTGSHNFRNHTHNYYILNKLSWEVITLWTCLEAYEHFIFWKKKQTFLQHFYQGKYGPYPWALRVLTRGIICSVRDVFQVCPWDILPNWILFNFYIILYILFYKNKKSIGKKDKNILTIP